MHVPYTAYGELILSWEAYGANCISLTITQTDVYFIDLGKHGLSWVKEEVENICLVVNEKFWKSVNECDNKVLCNLAETFPQQNLSSEDFWSNGLDFTEEGYNRMAQIIYKDMKHLL